MVRSLAAILLSLASSVASAIPIVYVANLSGANENPPRVTPATGLARVTFDNGAHTLLVEVAFSGLTAGNTAAHIHCCVAPPGNIGVATQTPTFAGFPTGATSGVYSHLFDLTLTNSFNAAFVTANGGSAAGAEAALGAGLAAGAAYLNIHTSTFPGGEIRGFLAVPEPGTLALLGLALGALAFRHRAVR